MSFTLSNLLNLIFYFLGSCFGLFLIIFFSFYGDLEYLSVEWKFLRILSDEWRLLISLLLFSFGIYCFLNLQHEFKKLSKPTLNWWQKGLIYQVYPKSFKDTSGNGVGDLKGIADKLDYIKNIGADIIWINPIFPSGGKDNGYDVTSYVDVDKLYGGMKEFDALVTKIHNKGLHLVMEFIPNHTSTKHEWFVKSCLNENKYRDYYIWYPSSDSKSPPNNWLNVIGNSAWTYNEKRKAWYYHTFLPDQPDLNMRNPDVRLEMKKIIKFWLEEKNVDGLRIDALKHLFKDSNFKNEPKNSQSHEDENAYSKLQHIYTADQAETFEILTQWRELADDIGRRTKTQKLIFVECHGTPQQQMKYLGYNDKPGCSFPMNFQLLNFCENKHCSTNNVTRLAQFQPFKLKEHIEEWNSCKDTKYFWSNWLLGNHDVTRVATRIFQENVKLANALVLLLGGTPITYYGEEIGMEDLDHNSLSFEECQDEFGKSLGPNKYKKQNRDYCRSPMQWDHTANAGFSTSKPWLPLNPNYSKVNVQAQINRAASTLQIYMDLTKLRQSGSFLWGSLRYAIVDEHIFSFVRSAFDSLSYLVAINVSDEDVAVNFFQTKLVPYTVNVAYYFDNQTNTPLDPNIQPSSVKSAYTLKQQINTKSVVLKSKSCVILSWRSS